MDYPKAAIGRRRRASVRPRLWVKMLLAVCVVSVAVGGTMEGAVSVRHVECSDHTKCR